MPSRIPKTSKIKLRKKKENKEEDEYYDLTETSKSSSSSLCNSNTESSQSIKNDNTSTTSLSNELKDTTNKMMKKIKKSNEILINQTGIESFLKPQVSDSSNNLKMSETDESHSKLTSVTETETTSNASSARTSSKKSKRTKFSHQLYQHLPMNTSVNHHTARISLNQSINSPYKSNKKITDYFQIRKSSRKCKSDIEKEKRSFIENALKSMKEEGLEIRNIENKGRGIFTKKYLSRGDFICEYAGEMVSYKVAKKREELYATDQSIGCYMYFFEYKSKGYCIDATAETTRLGRLINHSKLGSNCHTKLFEMNSRPYLIIMASRDITPGEELTYDYGDRNKMALESHPWLAE